MYADLQTRKIDAEKVFNAILQAATGTIKAMTSTLEAAKTIAIITHDVLETLRENGILVEKPVDTTPATNTRAVSAESKIAFMACQIILQNMPTQVIETEPETEEILIDVSEGGESETEAVKELEEPEPKKRGKK